MAKLHYVLDTRRSLENGTFPLKLSVFINGKGRIRINTGYSLKKEQWNNNTIIGLPLARDYNDVLRFRLTKVDSLLAKIELSEEIALLSIKEIQFRIEQAVKLASIKSKERHKSLLVADAFVAFAESAATEGTKSIYTQTLAKLELYYNMRSLVFAEITVPWLREFEANMKSDGLSINGISVHLRNLRAVYNRAIDDELIDLSNYPFRKFKIKSEATMKRSLTVEELRTLRDYDIVEIQEHQKRYRDMFMLIFYLIGINAVDLFSATEIRNGRLEFRRAKTGRPYSIKVEPEAEEIIENYAGKNHLLNICDDYGNYKDFLHRMNKNLKEIGDVELVANAARDEKDVKRNKKKVTALFPALSSYWARHTWATIAADLDIPDETISLALGHAGANSTTNIYINRNQRKVDDANRRVLDFVRTAESASDYLERIATQSLAKAADAAKVKLSGGSCG